MNFLKISAFVAAALLSVSAHAQIITNYGQATYPGSGLHGDWTGSGASIAQGRFTAQTFTAPTSGPIYAYNVQFAVLNGAKPSFTTAIYLWDSSTNSLGSLIENTTATFSFTADTGFNVYGSNVITNPTIGTVNLVAGSVYALVISRTDTGSEGGIAQVGRAYNDSESSAISYEGGSAYSSTNGTNFTSLSGGSTDNAFWVSFDPASLSPVPEPAVNGAIIGAVFVIGLVGYRRYGKKSAAPADQVNA